MKKIIVLAALVVWAGTALAGVDIRSGGISEHAAISGTPLLVIGKTVRNEDRLVLGKIENISLTADGRIDYVILNTDQEGAAPRYYPIPWDLVAVPAPPDHLLINLDVEILAAVPAITSLRALEATRWKGEATAFYEQYRSAMRAQPGVTLDRRGQMLSGPPTLEDFARPAGAGREAPRSTREDRRPESSAWKSTIPMEPLVPPSTESSSRGVRPPPIWETPTSPKVKPGSTN